MAEGFALNLLPDNIYIKSAGTEAHGLNPYTVHTMNEVGIDISHHKSKKINNDEIEKFDLVITLCGDAKDKCPTLNVNKHVHWIFLILQISKEMNQIQSKNIQK